MFQDEGQDIAYQAREHCPVMMGIQEYMTSQTMAGRKWSLDLWIISWRLSDFQCENEHQEMEQRAAACLQRSKS